MPEALVDLEALRGCRCAAHHAIAIESADQYARVGERRRILLINRQVVGIRPYAEFWVIGICIWKLERVQIVAAGCVRGGGDGNALIIRTTAGVGMVGQNPSGSRLVVLNDGVTLVGVCARAAQTLPGRVERDRSVEENSGGFAVDSF